MERGFVSRLAWTIGSLGAALALARLHPSLHDTVPSLFVAAVAVSAWHGLGQGSPATVLAAFALDYFLLPPVYSLLGLSLVDSVQLVVFLLVAVLVSSLNGRRKRLEQFLRQQGRRKDQFLTTLSHELRAPLDNILRAIKTLRCQDTDAQGIERLLGSAERQVQTMTIFVDELADVASISQGSLRLLKTSEDLRAVVDRAVEVVSPLISERNHRLTVQLSEGPLQLEADSLRMEQVVVNLLTNAARYTDPGGRIAVSAERENGEVVLRVRDTGIGLGPEAQAHLFDLFRQGKGADSGLGFGLSLVRSLVEMHGGRVSASSPGLHKGSELVVRLPISPRYLQNERLAAESTCPANQTAG